MIYLSLEERERLHWIKQERKCRESVERWLNTHLGPPIHCVPVDPFISEFTIEEATEPPTFEAIKIRRFHKRWLRRGGEEVMVAVEEGDTSEKPYASGPTRSVARIG